MPDSNAEQRPPQANTAPIANGRDQRRLLIGSLIDALPDENAPANDSQEPALPATNGQAVAENPSEPQTAVSSEDSIPTAAELFTLTAESIEPTLAPVAILPTPDNDTPNLPRTDYQEPDPHAVINRLITTATNQGALIAEQRLLLSATLAYVPEHLAKEIHQCLAESVIDRDPNNDDLIVIEDIAEGEDPY